MGSVYKAKVEVTIFLIADSEVDAREQFQHLTLSEIAGESEDGAWIGTHRIVSLEPVPSGQVEGELRAIGNDGRFFDGEE